LNSNAGEDARAPRTAHRDRLIAATITATPLLMPFYFDYDQLLLAIPAVLFAADLIGRDRTVPLPWTDRWLLRLWPAQYAWLMLNSDIADLTRVNLGVPLLAAVAGLLIVRAGKQAVGAVASSSDSTSSVSVTSLFADRNTDARLHAELPGSPGRPAILAGRRAAS
jgi:hypothetical protein